MPIIQLTLIPLRPKPPNFWDTGNSLFLGGMGGHNSIAFLNVSARFVTKSLKNRFKF